MQHSEKKTAKNTNKDEFISEKIFKNILSNFIYLDSFACIHTMIEFN